MKETGVWAWFRRWARTVKRDVVALWLAARDPRTPWYAKALALVVAAYAPEPIRMRWDRLRRRDFAARAGEG